MKLKNFAYPIYQSTLGVLVELAYSAAIMLASIGVIYLVLVLKWFSGRL